MKILKVFFAALWLGATLVWGVNYPKPVGYLNDFANIFAASFPQKQQLEERLRQYAKETSIEIAVVTVSSLAEETIEDYAAGLFNQWEIGDKKKDNGILFLIALNDHQTRIEVGYGLEPDLTDAEASRIIRDQIIPPFKEGKMVEGVVAGTQGILNTLGKTPFAARAEERKLAEAKRQKEAEQSIQAFKNFTLTALLIIIIAGSIIVVAAVVIRYLRKRAQLAALHHKNEQLLKQCADKINEARSRYPEASQKLLDLKRRSPEEVWGILAKSVENSETLQGQFQDILKSLENRQQKGDWQMANQLNPSITSLLQDISTAAELADRIQATIEQTKRAEQESSVLLKNLPDLIKAARNELEHPDISDHTRQELKRATIEYERGVKILRSGGITVNWLTIFSALTAASTLIASAKQKGANNRAAADRARKEGPALLERIPRLITNASRVTQNSDVSTATRQTIEILAGEFTVFRQELPTEYTQVDWPVIFPSLQTFLTKITRATQRAKDEINEEDERRRRRTASYTSTSSRSSNGGFGGFGGGRSGGAGASGKW